MKRWICMLLCLLALCLCACGGSGKTAAPTEVPAATTEPAATAVPEETETKPQRQSVLPGGALHEADAAEEETAKTVDASELVEQAQRFVDKPVAELIAELGEPQSRDYAPSCMGPGEDGELKYEGFTVYTYKYGDAEKVTGVE